MLGTWPSPPWRDHWGPLLTTGQKPASYCLTRARRGLRRRLAQDPAELVGNNTS